MKINYLYVEEFTWSQQIYNSMYEGHPKEGGVYRAAYNPESGWHFVIISEASPVKAIVIPSLVSENGIDWVGKIVNLTKENIINYNLKEEQLDEIIKWMDSNSEDIFKPQIPAPLQALQRAMDDQQQEDQAFLLHAIGVLEQLQLHNVINLDIIVEISEQLISDSLRSMDSPVSKLKLDKNNGLGANIADALTHITNYTSEDRRTNQDPDDLDRAIIALIRERERRILNELD